MRLSDYRENGYTVHELTNAREDKRRRDYFAGTEFGQCVKKMCRRKNTEDGLLNRVCFRATSRAILLSGVNRD